MLRLKANVSLELMNRAGYTPVKQVKIESTKAYLSAERIEMIKKRAISSGLMKERHE